MSLTRATQVKVIVRTDVPDDLQAVVGYRGDRRMRITRIDEQILDGHYSLCLTGPIVTKVGKDHSTHTGYLLFDGIEAPFPTALVHLPAGAGELRRLLREAGEGR